MTHLQKLQNKLKESKADAVLLTSEINQFYVSGLEFTDGYVLVGKNCAFLLADFRYIEIAKITACDAFQVIMPKISMATQLTEIISGQEFKTVAIEDATLSCSALEKLKKNIPNTEFLSGGSFMLDCLREIKDADEIASMAKAQNIADLAFTHILDFINYERTEIEIALELEFFMRSHGARATSFDTIAVSGTASSLPHGVPQNKKLERGFLTMDFGAKVDGYCSDMTRTVVIGHADSEMKKLYATVKQAQQMALDFIRAGVICREADSVARDYIEKSGYSGLFGHSLGHGVGLYIHENPRLSQAAAPEARLMSGQVVTDEPGIYIAGKYGCRIEDMLLVTDEGNMNFATSTKELIEI